MLRRTKELIGRRLAAKDGEIGHIKDLYFEDENWTVRYLVANTGKWLPSYKVLISPFAVSHLGAHGDPVPVNLTKAQIKESPSIDAELPVSRQYELEYYNYYGWPYYWQGPALWGPVPTPVWAPGIAEQEAKREVPEEKSRHVNPHLRTVEEVKGYHIHAQDGELGHVEDFVFEEENWAIQYLSLDTRNWWPGKRVLISPHWITSVQWETAEVCVDLDREIIKSAPEYDPSAPITREFEERLFTHYKRSPYWGDRMAA